MQTATIVVPTSVLSISDELRRSWLIIKSWQQVGGLTPTQQKTLDGLNECQDEKIQSIGFDTALNCW